MKPGWLSLYGLLSTAGLAAAETERPGSLVSRQKSNSTASPGTVDSVPIKVTNRCGETIWPAFGTQAGKGPNTGGFELASGSLREVTVSDDWQGRVWGRTNCSFNADGTKSSNLRPQACETGDCNGVLSCVVTGATPVTLFEIALKAGSDMKQTFYDISLVDGYNLPMGLSYIPNKKSGLDIPPNLTNCACVASAGHGAGGTNSDNSTYPMPYNMVAVDLGSWCPWDLQLTPPTKPGDGVYPYPDDSIKRPDFSPCLSGCAKTNAPEDCCTGKYGDSTKCKPNLYAEQAKSVCPDAYSYAFDDTTSTFIIPTGGGWEIVFCPSSPSTNILRTFGKELQEVAQKGSVSDSVLAQTQNITRIQLSGGTRMVSEPSIIGGERVGSFGALVVMLGFWACFW